MSLFIRVDCSFFRHRKTLRLRAFIGDDALWVPPALWAYAAEHQPDGDFKDYSDKELALAIGYTKDAQALLQALLQACFLDASRMIHDWPEHNGYHIAHRERAKKAAAARWSKTKPVPPLTLSPKEEEQEEKNIDIEESARARGSAPSIAPSIKPNGVPRSENEAIEWAGMDNVPADFARDIFQKCEGVGWLDGANRPIVNWRSYVVGRYSRSKTVPGSNGKPLSIFDLREIVKVKEERASALKERYSTQGPISVDWNDQEKRVEWIKLRKEIKSLKSQIEAKA